MKTLLIITLICAASLLVLAVCLLCICRLVREAKGALPADLIPAEYFIWRIVLGIFYIIVAAIMAALVYYGVLNLLQTVLCALVTLFFMILGIMVIRHYRTYIVLHEILTDKNNE